MLWLDRDACQHRSAFPLTTGRSSARLLLCAVCRRLATRWLVYSAGDLLPFEPCHLCDVCLRMLLYTPNGKKVSPNFRVHMYCDSEVTI
ncbi:unnamed protein product [Protopolystoma xenopodis]|uniref:snRNA-activating protein complex subunit 3 n=1 Tax=Protopolystoma xenopodis TaxID=117903 RepID=A0A3S4ZYF9_9PLAT|nr:unnamed protein product [Protopolystoma xenopodis]